MGMTTPEDDCAFDFTPPAALTEQTIGLIEQLCAISSPTGDHDGLAAVFERYADALREVGLVVRLEHRPGTAGNEPVLWAHGQPQAPTRPLLLVGHLDTVLPAWPPTQRDGRLSASGAADMKGGLAVLVGALHLLRQQGCALPEAFCVVVVPDEEILGPVTYWAMQEHGAHARALWVLEPGKHGPHGGETIVGRRRGMVHWQLDVRGRGAHAGNAYWQGRSALTAAAAWSVAASALSRPGDGPSLSPGRMVAGDATFVGSLPDYAQVVGTTAQLNIVPNRARVEGEARFLARADGEQLVDDLRQLTHETARRHGVSASFTASALVPPLEQHPAGQRWATRAVDLATQAGWTLEVEASRGGLSFPNFLPDPAALPVLDGLGPVGDGLHTRDEYVDLTSVARRIGLLAALLAGAEPS